MRKGMSIAVCGLLFCSSTGAFGAASGTASLSDFQIRLVDLDPNDGVDPTVSFVGTIAPWESRVEAGGGRYNSTQFSVRSSSPDRFAPLVADLASGYVVPGVGAYASSGDDHLLVEGFAHYDGEFVSLSTGGARSRFELTPYSTVEFSAYGSVHSRIDGFEFNGDVEGAFSNVQLEISGPTTEGACCSIIDIDIKFANVAVWYGNGINELSDSGQLVVTLTNPTANRIVRELRMSATTNGFTPVLRPVPEPSTVGIWSLAVLFGLSWLRIYPTVIARNKEPQD